MKIAFFHELHFGGARRVVAEYGKVFKRHHDIALFYVNNKEEKDSINIFPKTRFFFYHKKTYSGSNWKIKLYRDFLEPIKLYFLHKRIAKEIDRQKFDFIFVHPSQFTHAPFLLRFLKTPMVYYCQEPLRIAHDPVVAIPPNITGAKRLYELIVRKIRMYLDASNIKHATLVITNSNYSKRNIKEAYSVNAHVCYLGVNLSLFKPLKIKKEYDLLFVGDSIPMEGYDTLVEIIRNFDEKPILNVIKKKKGKYVTDEDLVRQYNKTKLVVVLGKYDPFSMIPWEAMACEVCPVVVKEGGVIEAVEDGKTGFLLDRNPKKFHVVLQKLLIDKKLREKIGKEGRKRVETFWNWEKSYERFMKIINESKTLKRNEA